MIVPPKLKEMKISHLVTLSFIVFMLFITAIAGPKVDTLPSDYGLFQGVGHGFMAPFSMVESKFLDHISVYAPNNSGNTYKLGFVSGIVSFILFVYLYYVLFYKKIKKRYTGDIIEDRMWLDGDVYEH